MVAESELRAELLLSLRRDGPFHVGVLLENIPEYLFLLAGAALAGAVIVGINPTRRGAELATDIRRADCQLLVTDSAQLGLVDQLDLGLEPGGLLVVDGEDYLRQAGGPSAPPVRARRSPNPGRTSSTCSSSPRARPVDPRRSG